MSRLHFQFSGTPTAADLSAMTSNAASLYSSTGLVAASPASVVLTSFVATSLFDNTMSQGIDAVNMPGTGSGSPALPAETAVVIAYAIARRYRGGHPRGYWPLAMSGNLASGQTWTTALVTAINAAFRAYVNGICAATYTGGTPHQVNISYYSGVTWHQKPSGAWVRKATLRATPIIDPVLAQNTRIRVGTQRRRMK